MKSLVNRRSQVYSLPVFIAGMALILGGCASSGQSLENGSTAAGDGEVLFNGRDLTGWNGDPRFWRVENGAIVGETTEENPIQQNSFLIWSGGTLEDFTITFEFLLRNNNSGFQYRSRQLEGWSVAGYQADMDEAKRHTGMVHEERGQRGTLAQRGEISVIDPGGIKRVVGSVGDSDELAAQIDMTEWNTYEVTAVGNHLVHKINGRVTAEVTDNDPQNRALSGIIAFQMHTGPPTKVEIRNIVLHRLSPSATAAR
jgi:hypothetical protein